MDRAWYEKEILYISYTAYYNYGIITIKLVIPKTWCNWDIYLHCKQTHRIWYKSENVTRSCMLKFDCDIWWIQTRHVLFLIYYLPFNKIYMYKITSHTKLWNFTSDIWKGFKKKIRPWSPDLKNVNVKTKHSTCIMPPALIVYCLSIFWMYC
jgi:hypothetical protein